MTGIICVHPGIFEVVKQATTPASREMLTSIGSIEVVTNNELREKYLLPRKVWNMLRDLPAKEQANMMRVLAEWVRAR